MPSVTEPFFVCRPPLPFLLLLMRLFPLVLLQVHSPDQSLFVFGEPPPFRFQHIKLREGLSGYWMRSVVDGQRTPGRQVRLLLSSIHLSVSDTSLLSVFIVDHGRTTVSAQSILYKNSQSVSSPASYVTLLDTVLCNVDRSQRDISTSSSLHRLSG